MTSLRGSDGNNNQNIISVKVESINNGDVKVQVGHLFGEKSDNYYIYDKDSEECGEEYRCCCNKRDNSRGNNNGNNNENSDITWT